MVKFSSSPLQYIYLNICESGYIQTMSNCMCADQHGPSVTRTCLMIHTLKTFPSMPLSIGRTRAEQEAVSVVGVLLSRLPVVCTPQKECPIKHSALSISVRTVGRGVCGTFALR